MKKLLTFSFFLFSASICQATYFYQCSTSGADTNTGLSRADTVLTSTKSIGIASAGDTIFTCHEHNESFSATTALNSSGTATSWVKWLCSDYNSSASTPTALSTTCIVNQTASNFTMGSGFTYTYGINFWKGGNGNDFQFNTAGAQGWWINNSSIVFTGSNVQTLDMNNASTKAGSFIKFSSVTVKFNSATSAMPLGARFIWDGGGVTGTIPNDLFTIPASGEFDTVIKNVDFSSVTTSLINTTSNEISSVYLENCKLADGVVLGDGNIVGPGATIITIVNCDSADTNYRYYKKLYQGEISQETTIVRTGGATDGTTSFSREMTSNTEAQFVSPLESDPVIYWNDTTGSPIDVGFEIVNDTETLTTADVCVQVEYAGTSGFPIYISTNDCATDILASTTTAQASSSVDWTTTGIFNPIKQRISVSITPQEKGYIKAWVKLLKPSETIYFDPVMLTDSERQWMVGQSGIVNEAPQTGGGGGGSGVGGTSGFIYGP